MGDKKPDTAWDVIDSAEELLEMLAGEASVSSANGRKAAQSCKIASNDIGSTNALRRRDRYQHRRDSKNPCGLSN